MPGNSRKPGREKVADDSRKLDSGKIPDNIRQPQDGKASQRRPMTKSRKRKEQKKKTWRHSERPVRWLAAAVLLAGIGLPAVLAAYWVRLPPSQAQLDIRPDEHARKGTLHAGEAVAVPEGEFWVVLNQLPTLEEGSQECNIEYENPSSNHYSARISLYLKETGSLLGNTLRVDPGSYVETIVLTQDLPPGEYPVTAKLELFTSQTPIGEMSLDITLRIVSPKTGGETG